MRKLLTFVAAVSVVACGATSDTGEDATGSSDEALTGNDVAALASANVGTTACGTNSLGGKAFDSSCTGNGGYPEYWCADFARWVWEKTGAGSTNELTAAAGSFYVYGQKHGTLHNTARLGDAVVFNYAGNGYADHVAIVTQVNSNGTIETVSGDWNGESGSEAHFSSTSHTVLNAPAYNGAVGTTPGVMGMTISGFIGPVGLDVPYAASYVAQSFPLATTTLTMVEGQSLPSYIELKNAGTKTWTSSTKLGTTMPRERDSALADSSWLAPNRPAAVSGTVSPGATYKFKFNLHAPDKVGTYDEHFGVLQEGVAWFGDSGQGGPADDVLEVKVNVIAPEWRGDLAKQSFPLAPATLAVHQGDIVNGFFELTNTGTKPWTSGKTELAPTPRDVDSPFADPSWLTPTRVSTVAEDVVPGDVGHFDVKLDTTKLGDFQVTFGLVQEGVAWFDDPTLGGGGPADGLLRVHLVVVPPGAPLDAGASGDSADAGDSAAASNAGADDASSGAGGCSLAAGSRTSPWGASMLAVVALAFVRRRRFEKRAR